ncbi:MAG TPA: methionine synthase [Mycobacteriales bacterium]|nr:methionine synthase [Mycobacteriales bacterium]
MVDYPWPAGAATCIGSLPGTDPVEALRIVLDELPDLPHQPELPARGPGADIIGRAAAMLVDVHVDLQPSGWRLVDRPGIDWRRGRDIQARDLDVLAELAGQYTGPFIIAAAGPWTLAASIELHRGDRAVADPGATRDLAQSLAEGVAAYAGRVRERVPRAELIVQLDEPSLPAVLAGRVPTASGYEVLRAVEPPVAEQALAGVIAGAVAATGGRLVVVHCCAPVAPVGLIRAAGAGAVSLDAALLPPDDVLGEAIEAGTALWLGLVPTTDPGVRLEPNRLAEPAQRLWRRLGFPPGQLGRQVVVTPACGLAGASPAYARAALKAARETGRVLAESPE